MLSPHGKREDLMRRILVVLVSMSIVLLLGTANAKISTAPCFGTGTQFPGSTIPGCWFLGDPGQSCTQTCTAHGLVYDDATRTVAGSDATDNGQACEIIGLVLDSPTTFSNDTCASPAQPGIGCIIDPGTPPGGVRCTQPTTNADAASLDSERICACRTPLAQAPALSAPVLAVTGLLLLGSGLWLTRRHRRHAE
jgi:hypothetical protein